MSNIDWIVMIGTLAAIVAYGVWKTRKVDNVKSYLMGDKDLPWWTIGLSVMATQASAITFLSTPGQAYNDGMRFAQFYLGMPLAMIIICIFFLPIYYRLNVYTPYEYLETRFDLKTRTLAACLFLLSRGMASGITIYAPSIILSSIFGWDLLLTILLMGVVVIFYTVLGGTKAVSVTQKQQMIIILSGIFVAAVILVFKLPEDVSFGNAVDVAGEMGKMNVIDFSFDFGNRYNFWSGLLGGTFLFLSYFGTDQSQVQRYLSGKSLNESRLGLLFNGIIKMPMQFAVLFIGVLVFMFFQFEKPPLHFNTANVNKIESVELKNEFKAIEVEHAAVFQEKQTAIRGLISAIDGENETAITSARTNVLDFLSKDKALQERANQVVLKATPNAKIKDGDYVFITFVMNYLPVGLVGLLIAVIFSAAMSSIASELNALATTTVIDIYKRSVVTDGTDAHYLSASKWFTVGWGILALLFAYFAAGFENLIQAVNIIGSLFYGVILGIFMVAFFLKNIGSNAVFKAALLGELFVVSIWLLNEYGFIDLSFLWLNLIGCGLVMLLAAFFSLFQRNVV